MNIATTLRYVNLGNNGYWARRYYIMHDYELMAKKYEFGLCAIMSEYDLDNICDRCDGLIIPGSGTNINPAYYGGAYEQNPECIDEYYLDAKLMEAFLKRGKPIFGVCGGHQAINIFLGGTMKRMPDPDAHQNHDKRQHEITIKKGSFVYDVFQSEKAIVNCHHGWQLDRIPDCLESVAETTDGVCEAIESKDLHIYATQWHPEQSFHDGSPLEQQFFANFLERCKECGQR